MPTVRSYQQQVENAPLPAVRGTAALTPDAAGVEGGKALSTTGWHLYQDELQRQDQVAFLEADRKLSEWENQALYDPKTGALNVRGKDSLGLPDKIGKSYKDSVDTIRKGLTTERQAIAFDRAVETRRKDINTTLSRHVFQEMRKFEDAETENYLRNSQQAAILNNTDPERIQTELDRQRAAIVDFASRNGLGPEYVKQKLSQAQSNTHVGVIDRFLAQGNDQTARKYFDEAKKQGVIAGDDIAKVEGRLQQAVTEGEGLRGAAAIWDKLGPKSDIAPVNLDVLMREAESQFANSMPTLKAVKQAIVERANTHNAAQRERREANSSAVWSVIEAGGTIDAVRRMPEYRALPGDAQAQIKEHIIQKGRSEITWAESREQKRRSDILWAESRGDDRLYYQRLTEASSSPLQDGFLQRNLYDDRASLSKTQFNHLAEVQAALRKGDTKNADKLLASDRQQDRMVTEALLKMKLDPTPNEKTSKDKIEQTVGFRRAVREAVSRVEQQTGKNADDKTVQGIVDGLVVEGVTTQRTFWFNETKRVYQLEPGDTIIIKPTDVPKPERAKIEAALRANDRAVTDEAVTTLYREKILKARGLPPAVTPGNASSGQIRRRGD